MYTYTYGVDLSRCIYMRVRGFEHLGVSGVWGSRAMIGKAFLMNRASAAVSCALYSKRD